MHKIKLLVFSFFLSYSLSSFSAPVLLDFEDVPAGSGIASYHGLWVGSTVYNESMVTTEYYRQGMAELFANENQFVLTYGLYLSVTGYPDSPESFDLLSVDVFSVPSVLNIPFLAIYLRDGVQVIESFMLQPGRNTLELNIKNITRVDLVQTANNGWPPLMSFYVDNILIDGHLIAAVPEPSTYAMMFAGLGMIAIVAKRRKSS